MYIREENMDIQARAKQIETARIVRENILADSARPGYHFVIPEDIGMPGDPNCAFYAGGRYHLLYLYECRSDKWRLGHMSSIDMVHWHSHPDALIPDETDMGVFSGGAFIDDDGTVYLTYWSLGFADKGKFGGIRIAYSRDYEHHFDKWEKLPGYAVESTELGITKVGDEYRCSADPSNIWKKDGYYYIESGNLPLLNKFRNDPNAPKKYLGDHVSLYRSKDLRSWEYSGEFYTRSDEWTDQSEDHMCSNFLPIPAGKNTGKLSDKYLELFIAHNRGTQYFIGDYDKANDRFLPFTHGRMNYSAPVHFAPEALLTPDNRQVMWGWIQGERANFMDYYWSGVYSIPRSLWMDSDGSLGQGPIDEIRSLRYLPQEGFAGLSGDSCEIEAEFRSGGGFKLRASADDSEYTLVYYDAEAEELIIDASHSDSVDRYLIDWDHRVEHSPLKLADGETLNLDIFIDHSVIEVFANDRQAACMLVFPHAESKGISLIGDEKPISVRGWEIMPSNMY